MEEKIPALLGDLEKSWKGTRSDLQMSSKKLLGETMDN